MDIQLRNAYLAKQHTLDKIFKEARDGEGRWNLENITTISGTNEEKRAAIDALSAELKDMGERLTEQAELDAIKAEVDDNREQREASPQVRSERNRADMRSQTLEAVATHEMFQKRQVGAQADFDIDLRTLFTSSAGWDPIDEFSGLVVPDASAPVSLLPRIPQVPTDQHAVVYMEQTTRTNNAAERAEGGAAAESAIAYTQRTQTVRSIDTFVPVVNEILDDVPQIRQLISNDIVLMLQQKIDNQILNADGSGVEWTGALEVGGLQTQQKGADDIVTAILRAKMKVMVSGRAMPSVCVIHPNDWEKVLALREISAASLATGAEAATVNTYNGAFIWGHPSQPGVEMIWGMPVVPTTEIAVGTALVGDFARYSQIRDRQSFTVEYGTPANYVLERKTAIIGGVRMVFFVTRGEAFCKVTGLNA